MAAPKTRAVNALHGVGNQFINGVLDGTLVIQGGEESGGGVVDIERDLHMDKASFCVWMENILFTD